MSYEPEKVFVKTENGAYTEITYQKYKTLRETDKSFAERKFIRVYVDRRTPICHHSSSKYVYQ